LKNLVIIIGTVILGCIIFTMIAGDSHSLKSASKGVMDKTIEHYEEIQ
jgi:hypothetical protein